MRNLEMKMDKNMALALVQDNVIRTGAGIRFITGGWQVGFFFFFSLHPLMLKQIVCRCPPQHREAKRKCERQTKTTHLHVKTITYVIPLR